MPGFGASRTDDLDDPVHRLQSRVNPDLETMPRSVAIADEGLDALTTDTRLAGTARTGPLTHTLIVGVDYQHTGQRGAAGFSGDGGTLDIFHPVYGGPITLPPTTFSARLNLEQTGAYAQDQVAWCLGRLDVGRSRRPGHLSLAVAVGAAGPGVLEGGALDAGHHLRLGETAPACQRRSLWRPRSARPPHVKSREAGDRWAPDGASSRFGSGSAVCRWRVSELRFEERIESIGALRQSSRRDGCRTR